MWSAAERLRQGLFTLVTHSTLSAGHTRARRGYLAAPSTYPKLTPSPIHPSPLPRGEVRWGCGAPSQCRRSFAPRSSTSSPHPPTPRTSSTVIPRGQESAAHDEASHHSGSPAALKHRLGGPLGYCGASDDGGRLGSCLRRNDGKGHRNDECGAGMAAGRRNDGGGGVTESAGAADVRMGDRGVPDGWWWLAASHPPPSLPPGRGEG